MSGIRKTRTERRIMNIRESGCGPIGSLLLLVVLTGVPLFVLFHFGDEVRCIADQAVALLTGR